VVNWDLAVDILATARLTRLATIDTFPPVLRLRQKITDNPKSPDELVEFIECPWCTSFWIALGVLAMRHVAPQLWDPVAKALAASEIAGVVHGD
jgi:Protein of unknown function (DUF1360)